MVIPFLIPLAMDTDSSVQKKISERLQSVSNEKRLAELELLGDQSRLEIFFSQSPDGFFFMMLDSPIQWDDLADQEALLDYVFRHQRVTKVNAAMLAQYDAVEDEFLGLTPQDFFAHDLETGRQLWREMFDKGRLQVETFERKLDGTSMWIEGDYNCLHNSEGNIIGHFGIQRDISHRKRAEEDLRLSQQELSDFVENAIVCLHWVASDGTIIWANQAELDLLGYTREEYVGHSITEFHANQSAIADILQCLLSNQPVEEYEADLRCKDGSIRHVVIDSNSCWSNDKFMRTRCFTRDITDRKCAEEALRHSEQRFRAIFDGTFQFMGVLTPEGILIEANRTALDAIAANLKDVVGQPFWATPWWAHSPESQEQLKAAIVRAAVDQALSYIQSKTFDVILLDLVLPDCQGLDTFLQIYEQAPLIPIVVLTGMADETLALRALQAGAQDYLVKGQASGSDLLIRSIRYAIERKRIQATLPQREQEFRTLADNAPDIIARFDKNLRHLYVNSAAAAVTGLSVSDFIGKSNLEVGIPEVFSQQLDDMLKQVLRTGKQASKEFNVQTPSGGKIYQSRFVPEFALDGSVESVLEISRDLTEQKQLETQFLRAQRLESLGTLASGIAHDMNNILAPMLASAQLLPVLVPNLDEQSQQLLQIFEDNTRRGTELVKQILTFARGLDGERTAVQAKHILAELYQIIKGTFPKSIEIVRNFPKQDLWLVSANATQLHQVFMNLSVNAHDAMPNGGTLSMSAENRVIDEIYARMHLDAKVGPYIVITFEDTGSGISPENIDRIFEPFFTTKPLGKGTGLGLSTVIGIIKSHGGFLTVSSDVASGTQFQVFLPAVGETEILPESTPRLPMGQGELILVVDDEASICETLKITLEIQNYKVLTAQDGLEAIAIYAKYQGDIKAVLMDMMMPSMDGFTAIDVLQQLDPQVKIIASSGSITRDGLPQNVGIRAFLQKPFASDDLFNTLHNVLMDES